MKELFLMLLFIAALLVEDESAGLQGCSGVSVKGRQRQLRKMER